MENSIIVFAANIVFVYMLLQVRIYIDFRYNRRADDDFLSIKVFTWRKLLLYEMKVPVIKLIKHGKFLWLKSELETEEKDVVSHSRREKRFVKELFEMRFKHPHEYFAVIREIRFFLRLYRKFILKILAALHCEKFKWETIYGSEDAAATGIAIGGFWALKRMLLTAISKRILFDSRPEINVIPVFNNKQFEMDFMCIFSIRVGNVINAGLSLLNPLHRR